VFFFSSRRRHTRWPRDWSSDVSLPIFGQVLGRDGQVRVENEEHVAFGGGEALADGVSFSAPLTLVDELHPRAGLCVEVPLDGREIGRASCREGVCIGGVGAGLKEERSG